MARYLLDAFSLSMLRFEGGREASLCVRRLSPGEARAMLRAGGYRCIVSSAGAARTLSELLGVDTSACTEGAARLGPGDSALVVAASGPHEPPVFLLVYYVPEPWPR